MITILSKIKWRYVKKFAVIAGSITGIYLLIATVVTLTLMANENQMFNAILPPPSEVSDVPPEASNAPENEGDAPVQATPVPTPEDSGFLTPPERTNFLLIALDQSGMLTDTLIAGCFYRDTCEIRMVSIPRDTYTAISEERLQRMRDDGRNPPSVMKINALRTYGGQAYGIQYLTEQLGEMLGVQFQYYAEINIPTFKKIVDALGGVWMEIPNIVNGGLYYSDPEQGLEIALPAGMAYLDGDKAEQLVRYRHDYATGDLGRNAVQMEFLKQLVRQAMTREAIMNDPITLINTLIGDVRTNLGPDIIKYTPYVTQFSGENFKTYTLPGSAPTINGVSYFLPDPESLPSLVNEVFYASAEAETESDAGEVKQSSDLRIQVLNGSRVAGLASSISDSLRYNGYNVVNTDSYTGSRQNATRILTRSENDGADLLDYFKEAEIEVDNTISPEYDMVIIIGQGEG